MNEDIYKKNHKFLLQKRFKTIRFETLSLSLLFFYIFIPIKNAVTKNIPSHLLKYAFCVPTVLRFNILESTLATIAEITITFTMINPPWEVTDLNFPHQEL